MHGAPKPLAADQPLPLWHEKTVWRVVGGHVDLFGSQVAADGTAGRRTFLARIGTGGVILPLPLAAGCGVLAVGGQGARIAAESVSTPAALAAADLDSWVETLCQAVGEPSAAAHVGLDEGTHDLAVGEAVRGRGRGPLWIEVVAGRARLGTEAGVELIAGGALLPLVAQGTLTALEPLRLIARRSGALAQAGRLDGGMAAFHHWVGGALARAALGRQRRLEAQVAARATQSRRMLEQGYADLARVVEPDRRPPPAGGDADAALAVVRRVAGSLDLPVSAAVAIGAAPGPHGRVGAILRASRLRARMVLLRDDWWRRDGGAMIGRRQGDHAPVALLPRPGGYVQWDAEAGETALDAARAAALEPQALAVYPRFLAPVLGPALIARLGLRGGGLDLARLLALALGTAALALLTPVASSLLVDQIIPAADRGQLVMLVAGLAVAALTTAGFELTKALTLVRIEGRLDFAVQAALFDRLLRLPAPFFKRYSAGDLADRVLGVQAIRQMLTGATVTSLLGGVFAVVSLGLLFAYSVPLAALAVGLAVLSCLGTALLVWLQLRREREVARRRGVVESLVLQLIAGVGKIAVAAAGERAMAHWSSQFAAQKRHAVAAQGFARAQAVWMAAFPPLATMAVFLGMAMLTKSAAEQGQLKALIGAEAPEAMGTGAFLAFNAAFAQFLTAMTAMVRSLSEVLGAVPLWERSKPVVAEIPEDGGERHAPGRLDGGIEFSGIGFSYLAGGAAVLKGFNATIRAGEYVALVGPSGGGKSTVMRLLLGLEQAGEGEVFLDGKPLSRLDLTQVRAQMGVVLQNNRILPGDLFHNIVGDSEARLEDAWEAAAMVGLDHDIRAMPMGMHTALMEGGATLSGGQRQRLAIARALVRRPRILLLDEATSALDNRTQEVVTQSLGRLSITRILVAHRLSTIAAVDTILVIDHGRVVQRGSYQQLLSQPGLFAEMAKRQII